MFIGVSGPAPFLETYWRHIFLTYPLPCRPEKMSLGRYTDLSLKAAWCKRDKQATLLAGGRSPAEEKRLPKMALTRDCTVRDFSEQAAIFKSGERRVNVSGANFSSQLSVFANPIPPSPSISFGGNVESTLVCKIAGPLVHSQRNGDTGHFHTQGHRNRLDIGVSESGIKQGALQSGASRKATSLLDDL